MLKHCRHHHIFISFLIYSAVNKEAHIFCKVRCDTWRIVSHKRKWQLQLGSALRRRRLWHSHACNYKKLSCRRGTARCVVSVEILPIATQQCRTTKVLNKSKLWSWRVEVGWCVVNMCTQPWRGYMGCKILKRVSWPWPRPFQGRFFIGRVGLYQMYQISRFTRYEAMNDDAKCRKWGWFGVVRGHSRSSAMSPFDKAHTTSYSTLIETMRLSRTVYEI